jgi:hypothetical protein
MRKLIYIVIKVLSFLLIGIILCLFLYRLTSYHYQDKFRNVKISTHIQTLKKDWGKPDYEGVCVNCSGDILLKYKKDPIGWDAYIFLFNPKDSLLVSKNIDD